MIVERLFPPDRPTSLAALSLLGALCGALAGAAIIGLHHLIDLMRALAGAWHDHNPGNWIGGAIALVGALLLGLVYQLAKPRRRGGGFVHIIERLAYHQGQMPAANTLLQFFGTSVALGSGLVVGREGSAAHLGAAAGSYLGQRLEQPNTVVRTLVGCGVAAGIAASFNTPLAGVIFTMEVIVMEYSVLGLAPVILAAVSANAVAHLWVSSHPQLVVGDVLLRSYLELPYLLLVGVLIGAIAGTFSRAVARLTGSLNAVPVWLAMTGVGALTGGCILLRPELAQDGFVLINQALSGELHGLDALVIGVAVLLCAGAAIASAIPGGVLLPCMLAGACLGSVLGSVGAAMVALPTSDNALYAVLGLGAMMGAVLQAPLTALIVVLELSGRTEVVFPAMLTVITAVLVARAGAGNQSVFAQLLRNRGLDYRNDPVSQSLRRISVMAAMNRNFRSCPPELELAAARALLSERPEWLLVTPQDSSSFVLPAADLLRAVSAAEAEEKADDTRIPLGRIPAERLQAAPIHLRASLQEAYDALSETGAEALYAERQTRHDQRVIYGILTRQAVDGAYRP